jgi:POT family proton-dependent oligopeptide transporter
MQKKMKNTVSSSSSISSNKSSDTLGSTSSSKSNSSLLTIFKISALIIPFNIAYSQMATTFIIQGTVMKRAFGWIDAASMNNADAVSVLLFGHLVGSHLYPYLNRHNIKLTTTNKFALGSALGTLAIAWALFLEHKIHKQYELDGKKISILWQALAYVMIGAGEIFAVSAAYEVAFTAAPPEQKVLASALNLFCVGGIPNLLCLVLYNLCSSWFIPTTNKSSISRLEDYVSAEVYKYFMVLLGVALLGVIINLLPVVQNFVRSVEEAATESIKTPNLKTPLARRRKERKRSNENDPNKVQYRRQQSDDSSSSTVDETDEEASSLEASPLLRMQRHKAYLKYGSGPQLYKAGSMRASHHSRDDLSDVGENKNKNTDKKKKAKFLNKHEVGKLYRNTSSRKSGKSKSKSSSSKKQTGLVMTPEGKPLQAGSIMKGKGQKFRQYKQDSL